MDDYRDVHLLYSLVIPVYKNEENIPRLIEALASLSYELGQRLEVIMVVDGSPDNCYTLLEDILPLQPYKSQLVSLSRNFGSFAAIRCGLSLAQGQYFAVMAADLQEPPHLVLDFFKYLESDVADVVFGQRITRKDGLNGLISDIYWLLYRKLVISDIPQGGVDIFGCNRKVRSAILRMQELNTSLISQLFWVGYRRYFIPYNRQERKEGKSAWRLSKKLRYMFDSLFSFSDFPIIVLMVLGITGVISSIFIGSTVLLLRVFGGIRVPGYTPIVLIILGIGSILVMGQGILGGYLWRTLQNTMNRPITLVAVRRKYEGRKIKSDKISE